MCECYTIGGPFIAEDPDCEAHGAGGLGEQLEEANDTIDKLRQQVEELEKMVIHMGQMIETITTK